MTEIPLSGGFVNRVVRVDDTVRRDPGESAVFVHRLLRFLEERGWPGAPRFLGIDSQGREILTYIVYRFGVAGPRPVALIDWDLAAPGARVHDVAHMCWQYLDLGPEVSDLAEIIDRMRLLCDAYGLEDRGAVVEAVLWWQRRCRRGIESGAAAGDAAMVALREAGAVRAVGAAYEWVRAHRGELESGLR
ncbi:hypothetical protein [Nocardia wallacei]|uniref:hypothetical protein n=1 Tax=Nocardia wallacei TaxID=480035 RepID=UPI0024584F2F|nr:hypothetical protein [Nocardia wallacei]